MTVPELRPIDSTSAAGSMRIGSAPRPVLVGRILAGLGTSTSYASLSVSVSSSARIAKHTAADRVAIDAEPAGAAIGELHRVSGLTWEQLARVFGVSRRALHFWASGKPMARANEEHLQRVLAVVRAIDRGSANDNRAALIGVREDGTMPLDLLVAGQYELVIAMLGRGPGRRSGSPQLSDEARAGRAPRPPEELVGALHDRIHPTSGALRAAKSVKVRSGR